jgi:hypothetical protein
MSSYYALSYMSIISSVRSFECFRPQTSNYLRNKAYISAFNDTKIFRNQFQTINNAVHAPRAKTDPHFIKFHNHAKCLQFNIFKSSNLLIIVQEPTIIWQNLAGYKNYYTSKKHFSDPEVVYSSESVELEHESTSRMCFVL